MPKIKYWVLDSNVLSYWILAKKIFPWLIEKQHHFSHNLVEIYYARYEASITLVDLILNTSFKNLRFYTFDLNVFEVFNSIKEEVKSFYLFIKGHPLSRWGDKRIHAQINIDEYEIQRIYSLTMEGINELSKKVHVWKISSVDYENGISLFSFLVLHLPDLRTHDGLILSNALINNADRIVTNDSGLTTKNKLIKELFLEQEGFDFEIVAPDIALVELLKISNK